MPAPRPLARSGALLALAAAAAHVAPAAGAQTSERHTLAGTSVAVYDLAGRVRLVAGTGGAVVVEVARGGADGRALRVEQGTVRGRETLRVVFPDDRIVYPALGRWSSSRTRVRDDGTFGDDGDRDAPVRSHDVEIRGSGRGTEAWADLTVAVPRGQRVALHLVAGEATVTNVDGDLLLDVGQASVETRGTKGRLVVDAGSGHVRVDDAEGEVQLDTGSGATEVRGVRGSVLRVDAGSGSVTADDVDAPKVDLDVGSGRARLSRIRARELRVDAGSGSVDLGLVDDVDDVHIDTGSGGVTLRVPDRLGAEVDIDTGSGGITSEVPITVTRRERDRLVGRIGDGRGRIVIEAGSGGVRLVRG